MEVKEYIIEEADRLFCQYGFKSVTMDDIAKQLGMSKKTIYQHFSDKDELVNILILDKLSKQECTIDQSISAAPNAVVEILSSIATMNDQLTNMNAKLFFDLQKYHPKAWLIFKDFKEKKLKETIYKNLVRGVEQGLYREDINLEILTQLRLNQLDTIFNNHNHDDLNKYSLVQIMIEITEHFLHGICNLKGLAIISEYKQNKTQSTTQK